MPAAMLTAKVVAERTAGQCSMSASSGNALDVRWAKAHATLAPPGNPAIVTKHLATRLGVSSQDLHLCCTSIIEQNLTTGQQEI